MLKHNKRKILVFSLLAMFLLIPFGYDVFAETPEEKITKHKDTCVPELLINKYKLSIETVEGTVNQYRIYVNGEDAGDAQFRVTKVEAGTLLTDVSTAVIKKGQDLYLNMYENRNDLKYVEGNKYNVYGLKEGNAEAHCLSLNGQYGECIVKVLKK